MKKTLKTSPSIKPKLIKPKKLDKYLDLFYDQNKLINSSQVIIRKKHSPLILKIRKGNVKSIMKATRDKIFGALAIEQRIKFCKMLCEIKYLLKNRFSGETTRGLLIFGLSTLAGIADVISSMTIGLIWILRAKLYKTICKCKMDYVACTA